MFLGNKTADIDLVKLLINIIYTIIHNIITRMTRKNIG